MPCEEFALGQPRFESVKRLIEEESGISLRAEKLCALESLVAARAGELAVETPEAYLELLGSNQEELQWLIPRIANHETFFFRDRAQLALFGELLKESKSRKEKTGHRRLRVLSAGCAGGEEAYTLNIMIRESGLFSNGWDIKVTGMDLDPSRIEAAARAVYPQNSLRLERSDTSFILAYFIQQGRSYTLKPQYRAGVEFRAANLLKRESFAGLAGLDFIFCRNVFIYMTDRAVAAVSANLHSCLADDGYLFVGSSEALHEKTPLFVPERGKGAIVYRKSGRPLRPEALR